MDIGAVYRGYGSDIACTCFGPKAPQAYKALYQVLCDGQRIIIDGLKPGAKGKELFHKGQEYVRQHGYS